MGERSLGIEAAQLIRAAQWLAGESGHAQGRLEATGMRSQAVARVAAALEPKLFTEMMIREGARLLERSIYETGAVSGRSGTVLLGPLPVLRFDGAGGDGVVSALARAGARELKRGWDIGRRCCREHQYSGAEQPAGVTLRILTPQDYYPATRDLEESRMQSHFQKTKVYQEPRRSALLFSAA